MSRELTGGDPLSGRALHGGWNWSLCQFVQGVQSSPVVGSVRGQRSGHLRNSATRD